jgi:hypothetical protein
VDETPILVKTRRVLYVAGPYRGDVQANIQAARYAAMELWRQGWAVVCPHANSGYMDVDGGIDDDTFLRGDLAILERCDEMVVLPGWQDSAGTKTEIAHAYKHGVRLWFYPQCMEHLAGLVSNS